MERRVKLNHHIERGNLVDSFTRLFHPTTGERRPRRLGSLLDATCPDALLEPQHACIGCGCAGSGRRRSSPRLECPRGWRPIGRPRCTRAARCGLPQDALFQRLRSEVVGIDLQRTIDRSQRLGRFATLERFPGTAELFAKV